MKDFTTSYLKGVTLRSSSMQYARTPKIYIGYGDDGYMKGDIFDCNAITMLLKDLKSETKEYTDSQVELKQDLLAFAGVYDKDVNKVVTEDYLEEQISGLSGAMHFRDVVADLSDITDPQAGDVAICGYEEYIYTDAGVWKEIGDENLAAILNITYNDLQLLISSNLLENNRWYRITDYVTTTAAADTQSAGHQFDIIVHALDDHTLAPDAYAMVNSTDSSDYWDNADLSKWELKYDINNDTTKYTWADAINGKGVIYWMRDEYGNEYDYDFKNIMFKKYKIKSANDIHLSTNASPLATKVYNQIVTDLSATYTDDNEVYAMWYIPHSGSALYVSSSDFSSFSYTDWTPDANAKYIEIMFGSNQKGYIVAEVVDDGFFYTFDNYNTASSAHEDYSLSGNVTDIVIGSQNRKNLPFINFIGKNNTRSFGSTTIKRCRYSVFGYSSSRVYLDTAQWFCIIGINGMRSSVVNRIIIGTIKRVNNNPQTVNSIYVYFIAYAHIMGNNNYLTGGSIQYAHFGYNCYYNDIRQGNYILLDENCSQNTFGENCESIKLGNECCRNVFGNRARYITSGDKIQNSIFGPDCNNIIIGQDANNLQDYAQAIEVDATTCYVNIYSTTATSSTTYLNKIVVKNSASGTSTTPKAISTTAGNSHITTFRGANDTDVVV